MYEGFRRWESEIIERTGTNKFTLVCDEDLGGSGSGSGELKHKTTFDIKGEQFELGFNEC